MLSPKRLCFLALVLVVALGAASIRSDDQGQSGLVKKKGVDLDIRSHGRQIADEVAALGTQVAHDPATPVPGLSTVPQVQFRGGNVQANDGSLDNIQVFAGFRPFVEFTQSETSVAAFGRNIVATYNSSANQPLSLVPPPLHFTQMFLSGFSTSNDGGQTWTSGFFPPVPGSIFTFGDPSIDVDRHGNFYFAGLGANPSGQATVQVNKSTDGGRTWSNAVVVQQDNGSDKEWLAVGPDPLDRSRDNVYVTWTSFRSGPPFGSQLRFGRSTDGGLTWTTKIILNPGPDANPTHPQQAIQFSNPYVDPITGRLYVPFLHFSNSDQDFIRILISGDAGDTFTFATFNISGAPNPTLLPITSAGELIDCGSDGGFRLAIRAGSAIANRFNTLTFPRRFVQASRLVTQPAFAARNGVLYLAWSNSTSTIFGDPSSQSNIMFMRSHDGGATWSGSVQVNPTVSTDKQHVLPSLAIDNDPNDVHISYYTQHADGTVDVDMANSHDRGDSFPANRTARITPSPEVLAPTNIPRAPAPTVLTTNYDRTVSPCYSLGEYMSVKSANGTQYVLWGDLRNSVTQPVNALDPISGQTHSQQDVFFQKVNAQ